MSTTTLTDKSSSSSSISSLGEKKKSRGKGSSIKRRHIVEEEEEEEEESKDERKSTGEIGTGPFVVVRVYYKHGESTTDSYSTYKELQEAMTEHIDTLREYQSDAMSSYQPSDPLTIDTLNQLCQVSASIMTAKERGYRWDRVISGRVLGAASTTPPLSSLSTAQTWELVGIMLADLNAQRLKRRNSEGKVEATSAPSTSSTKT